MSPALLPDQRANFHAASNRIRSLKVGVMDMFLGLAKGMEACFLFSLPFVSLPIV